MYNPLYIKEEEESVAKAQGAPRPVLLRTLLILESIPNKSARESSRNPRRQAFWFLEFADMTVINSWSELL